MKWMFLAAGAAIMTSTTPLLAQLSDQSGPLTFSLRVAKHVEVVSHAPSHHDLLPFWGAEGMAPGYGSFGTANVWDTAPTIREVRANTPYRVTVLGLTSDNKLVFRNTRGDELRLEAACEMLENTDWEMRTLETVFDCQNSPVFPAAASRWVLFHAYTRRKEDTSTAAAGVYTATVFIQVDAV